MALADWETMDQYTAFEKGNELVFRRPREMLKGVAEVFVGRDTISRGSGLVVGEDGFAVSDTNVVGVKETVYVKHTGEEKVRSAKVISKNFDNFLALLKMPEGQYPALETAMGVNIGENGSTQKGNRTFFEEAAPPDH